MGKHTQKNRKKKLAKMRKKKAGKHNLEFQSVEEILSRAQEEIDNFQYEEAQQLCQEALKREPDNVAALETSASLCLEVGNLDGAKHCLGRAITLQPEEGHEKYMSMAQLMDGKDSLQCYQKGIEILTRVITNLEPLTTKEKVESLAAAQTDIEMAVEETNTKTDTEGGDENASPGEAKKSESEPPPSCSSLEPESNRGALTRQVSTAHCSVAELFMTDLCDEEEAEEQCRASIMQAIEADPTNPEAYQHMASFLLVKQETQEAKTYITKSIEIWLPKYKEVNEGKAEAGTFDPVEVCPLSYPARLNTARILIEVGDHKHALEVLEGLTVENDEVVDTWYLLGWSHYLQGEEHREATQHCLHRALQVHKNTPCEDSQLVDHLKELTEELGPYLEVEDEVEGLEEELEKDSDEEEEEEEEATSEQDQNMDTS